MNTIIGSTARPVATALIQALQRLPTIPTWSAIVAENIYWASCECFLQSSLLWSINTLAGSKFLSDREKLVTGTGNSGTKPDLLFFRADCHAAWRAATRTRKEARQLGVGFVYVKLAWSEGDATGSATIPAKASAIVDDIGKLRELEHIVLTEQPDQRKELLVVVGCVSTRKESITSVEAANCCESDLLEQIERRLSKENCKPVRPIEPIWLTKGEKVPSAPSTFASLRAMVLEVHSFD